MANEAKSALLKMPFGTANGKLRKMLLFEFTRRLGLLQCHRCGEQIVSIDDFSMDHKIEWQSAADPIAAFFDLENIAFSHLSCNSSAANRRRIHASASERHRAGHIRHRPKHAAYMRRKREENPKIWR